MNYLLRDGLMHVLFDVDKWKRAGITSCSVYVDCKPSEVVTTAAAVTCVPCAAFALAEVVSRFVQERWQDRVAHCKAAGDHNRICDSDGYCCACGYLDIDE